MHQFAESQWVGFQTNTRPLPIASGTTRIAPVVTIVVPSAASCWTPSMPGSRIVSVAPSCPSSA